MFYGCRIIGVFMSVTNAKHIAVNGSNKAIKATINGVEWSVPLDPDNRHYQAIQEWVAEGNTIEEAD